MIKGDHKRGKDPPAEEGDFGNWGKPLPTVDEALINESFEQFDYPADETDEFNDETFGDVGELNNEWEVQHEQRAKALETEISKLKVSEKPAVVRTLEKEESFFSFGGDEFPGKDNADEALDERILQEDKQLSAIFKTVLDDADERKLGEYTPFGAPTVGDRHIWNTPSAGQPSPAKKTGWDSSRGPEPTHDRAPGAGYSGSPGRAPGHGHGAPQATSTAEDALKKMLGLGGGKPGARPVPAAMSAEDIERQMLQGGRGAVQQHGHTAPQQPPQYAQTHAPPQAHHHGATPQQQHGHAASHHAGPKGGKHFAHSAAAPLAAAPAPQVGDGAAAVAGMERKFRPLVNYKRWTESKQYMAAEEIDSIIRMQLAQLQTDNPFVDDFYYQNYVRRTGKPALADEVSPAAYHKPICEASPRPQKKYTNDLLAGALGRVPSHSVRAPRPLVVIQREQESGMEQDRSNPNDDNFFLLSVMHSVLLAIEDAYSCLLDIEDMDGIKNALGQAADGAQYLQNKRRAIVDELFKLLSVYIPDDATPMVPDPNNQYIFSQDEFFVRLSLIPKGRRLVVRALNVLSKEQVHFILLTYVRNFRIFVDPPKSKESEVNLLFEGVLRAILSLPMASVVLIFQTIYFFYLNGGLTPMQFIRIKAGGKVIAALLKRAAELAAENDPARSHPALAQTWDELFNTIFNQLAGQFSKLFGQDPNSWNDTWEFIALIAANGTEAQRAAILDELRERLRAALKDNPWSGVRLVLQAMGKSQNDL